MPGGRLPTERAAAGKRFGLLSRRLRCTSRAWRDERDVRKRQRSACEKRPSIFGKSLRHAVVRGTGRTVVKVRTWAGVVHRVVVGGRGVAVCLRHGNWLLGRDVANSGCRMTSAKRLGVRSAWEGDGGAQVLSCPRVVSCSPRRSGVG